MTHLLRLANSLILANTRHAIDPEDRQRVALPCGDGEIEAWVMTPETPRSNESEKLFAMKFPGTGGRAERAGPHPCEVVSPDAWETWAINPPGYGTSTGEACVTRMPATCDTAWNAMAERAGGRQVIVTGNSLGGLYALYVAARYPVAGVLLRNPAPIHELIRGRYSWWNFGLASRLVGQQVPASMNAVANAKKSSAPLLLVMSESDRTIPVPYQRQVLEAYAGPSSLFVIEDADHHSPVPERQLRDYRHAILRWSQQLKPEPPPPGQHR